FLLDAPQYMGVVRAYYNRIAAELGGSVHSSAQSTASEAGEGTAEAAAVDSAAASVVSGVAGIVATPYVPSPAATAGRADFATIASWIPRGARVLDLGCG